MAIVRRENHSSLNKTGPNPHNLWGKVDQGGNNNSMESHKNSKFLDQEDC